MMYQNPLTRPHEKCSANLSLQEWQKQALNLREEFGQEQVQIQFRIQTLLKELEQIVDRDWNDATEVNEKL